jgi:hypothetical protein
MRCGLASAGITRFATIVVLATVAAALALLARAPAFAEDGAATRDGDVVASAPTKSSHDWEFSIAPYVWLSDVVADISYRDVSAHVDPSLWDLVSDLEAGFMGTLDVYHRPSRLSFTVDAFWMRLSTETDAGPFRVGAGPFTFQSPGLQKQVGPIIIDTPRGPLTLGPFDVDTGGVRLDVPRVEFPVGPFEVTETMTQSAVRASFGYRVLDRPLASLLGQEAKDDPRRIRGDLYAGGRYWYVKARTQVEYPPIRIPGFTIHPSLVAHPQLELPDVTVPGVTFGGADIDEEVSSWWIDPIVGARVEADLCGRLGLVINGNVGGFGIGSASEFSWETLGLLTWRLGEHWTAAAGYRALGVDRQKGDLEIDLIMHGALLGIIYRFP